jgi:hypothetical protein
MMGANPGALIRLWEEFSEEEDDVLLGGIYAGKGGYHNTRHNHQRGIYGGSPGDYSIEASLDKLGSNSKAAAIDLTFKTAQRSDFKVIAKYSKRLWNAMEGRDSRLFYDGKPVVREFFGNTDDDREVEGYSLYRSYPVSSDISHLWHIHISFHRWAVENWAAVKGVLLVLLDQEEDMPLSKADLNQIREIVEEALDKHANEEVKFGEAQRRVTGFESRSRDKIATGAYSQAFAAAQNTSDDAAKAVKE